MVHSINSTKLLYYHPLTDIGKMSYTFVETKVL